MDKDGDGLITLSEFKDFLVQIEAVEDTKRDEGLVKTMFEMFDKNQDGKLSLEGTLLYSPIITSYQKFKPKKLMFHFLETTEALKQIWPSLFVAS